MARANHQSNFATNLTSNTNAGETTSPLNAIPSVDAPFYLAFDATNINGHYEALACTSKTATNVNHAALAYAHTTAEEVRLVIPAAEMNNLGTLVEQTNGAWVAWTPTITGITLGNGTVLAKYTQVGKTVNFYVKITFGSTTTLSTSPSITTPVSMTLSTSAVDPFQGTAIFRDSSATLTQLGFVRVASATEVILASMTVSGAGIVNRALTSTAPFTWATGDVISITGTYEAA